ASSGICGSSSFDISVLEAEAQVEGIAASSSRLPDACGVARSKNRSSSKHFLAVRLWLRWLARDGAEQDYGCAPPLTPGLGSKSKSPQRHQRVFRADRSVVENFSAIRAGEARDDHPYR
ncbi:hypothetical protein, partial [Mycobacterium intracellulare]|uniref:hypothetical protein n=1 Tax=Mycobacterium intracellulare TaxID=1767 RepID=UPI001F39AD6A